METGQQRRTEGVVIIVPGAGESADWPQAIGPLRRKLPDAAWGSLSLSLPDLSVDTLPPRVIEAPDAAVDTSSNDSSAAAKPIEQAASAEAEGTDPAVIPGVDEQDKTDADTDLRPHRRSRGLRPDPERPQCGAAGAWHRRLVGRALSERETTVPGAEVRDGRGADAGTDANRTCNNWRPT